MIHIRNDDKIGNLLYSMFDHYPHNYVVHFVWLMGSGVKHCLRSFWPTNEMFEQRNKACGQDICLSTDSIVPITPKKVKPSVRLLKNHDNTSRKALPFIT